MNRKWQLLFLSLIGALALVIVACDGGDEPAAPTSAPAPTSRQHHGGACAHYGPCSNFGAGAYGDHGRAHRDAR